MIDTPIAIEKLVTKFGGTVTKHVPPAEYPNVIICSTKDYETNSTLLQQYRALGYAQFFREDYLYDLIIDGSIPLPNDYIHE